MSLQSHTNASEWTIGRLLSWATEYLAQHDIDDARLAGEVMLAYSVKCRRIDLYVRFDEVLDTDGLACFRSLVKRAAAHEPTAYLVGEKEFFSLAFSVTPDVLIPRPETETLVEVVIDYCTTNRLSRARLLDIGTGCGCIAVAVLKLLDGATVVATDIALPVLEVAKDNAQRLGVLDRFTPVAADRAALPCELIPRNGFDVVMSNPPYIAGEAMDTLDATVRDYEPRIALTDGEDGLSFYRCIAVEASPRLAPKGVVFVEVGDGQAQAVRETIEGAQALVYCRSWKDRTVGQERVLMFARC